MARATWLLPVLRDAGLHVVTMNGWETRQTRDGFDPRGLVWHHTATPKACADTTVRALLRDGRPDLAGPLAQLGLERDGTFVLVAAGRCNHNGYGLWGNDSFGIEAYNDGIGEVWPPAQLDAFDRGSAAICRHLGWDPLTQIKAHRETDPTRKIDPANLSMDAARGRVLALLTTPAQEDDMAAFEFVKVSNGRTYVIGPNGEPGRLEPEEIEAVKKAGWPIRSLPLSVWNKGT